MLRFSDAVLSKQERLSRWGFLGLTTAPLVGAALFNHSGTPPFLICPFRAITGIPCPGCGLTRSFMAIARGDFENALRMHLFGPVLFLAFAGAAVLMGLELKPAVACDTPPFTPSIAAFKAGGGWGSFIWATMPCGCTAYSKQVNFISIP